MTFAGTTDPAFTLLVVRRSFSHLSENLTSTHPISQTSLDNITPEKNEVYSKELAAFLEAKLGLKSDRGYM